MLLTKLVTKLILYSDRNNAFLSILVANVRNVRVLAIPFSDFVQLVSIIDSEKHDYGYVYTVPAVSVGSSTSISLSWSNLIYCGDVLRL